MLTARSWWFLLAVCLTLALGLLGGYLSLTLVALTLLLWFGWEWLLFAVRVRTVAGSLRVDREVWDERGPVTTLWAGQRFRVLARLRLSGRRRLPFVAAADRVPFGVTREGGSPEAQGEVRRRRPLEVEYVIRCPGAGLARFEGMRVQIADLQGFFYHTAFVRDPVVLRVLPRLTRHDAQTASTKRNNLLPPPGIHRLRQPGSGSELLDLRDYRAGDPPKTIAWKLSARRDRLITKEFESEVPVRCTLFVDTSNSVRVRSPNPSGPAGAEALAPRGEGNAPRGVGSDIAPHSPRPLRPSSTALARLTDLAASLLQTNAANRDLTGLCLFDDESVQIVRPGRTRGQVNRMLQRLADAAALAPAAGRSDPDALLPLACSFAHEVYPELMRPAVNATPFWLTWFMSFPGYPRRRRRGFWGSLYHSKRLIFFLFSAFLGLGLLFLPGIFIPPFALLAAGLVSLFGYLGLPQDVALVAGVVAGSLAVESLPVFLFLLTMLVTRRRQRLARWRKQMAALLAARYGPSPGGLAALLEDDDLFAQALQRFLGEHRVPFTPPLYDEQGQYLFAAPGKIPVLSKALLHAVGKGHDNELFVLLADLLELDGQLDPLLRAVRVALGRHHQVILVCPWPPGVPPPSRARGGEGERGREGEGEKGRPSAPPSLSPPLPLSPSPSLQEAAGLRDIVQEATNRRLHEAYRRLRRTFTRLGVPVVCAAGDEPVPLVLDRLDRLRAVRRKRR